MTRGLYALWHPSERTWGIHPLPILDALMRLRKTPYYVGLLSAADYYGAAHHKPQVLQVIIPNQLVFRKARQLGMSFHVRKKFTTSGIVHIKNPSGLISFSSPELTALDLLYFETACGGFSNVCLVIHSLMSKINAADLENTLASYPISACIQRLGYLLEFFGAPAKILIPLKRWIKREKAAPVALSPSYPKKGHVHPLWKVVENARVDIEP